MTDATAARAAHEREAHNVGLKRQTLSRILRHLDEGPSAQRRTERIHQAMLKASGERVLEIGSSAWTVWIEPEHGHPAHLDCLNISEHELQHGIALAAAAEHDWIEFHLMDAHKLDFPDNSFDMVYGGAIFHHLDCATAFSEVRRVLKPGGRFVITEPLGMNPIAKLVRALTPAARTADEKPFDMTEISLLRRMFIVERMETFELFAVPAGVLSGCFMASPVNTFTKAVDAFDRFLFRLLPPSRYWARQVMFELRKAP